MPITLPHQTSTPINTTSTPGKVFLVGAGPGDPELLTLKAKRVLQQCDVLLYDYLVDSRIVGHCNPNAEKHYVGKSGLTGHALPQDALKTGWWNWPKAVKPFAA